ncbi:hypothetical protein GW17_00027105 [Ensete ventricosum]|nr:hypothetical protein GW17_00027105 [Ensete ventricosum]RZS27621.1 hypothetical protein BHM03_00061131 [Ensete ventricosum]
MEVTTSSKIEPLLSSRASYTSGLSRADDELKSFQSCLGWVCIDQSDATHAMVYWSIFLLLCIHIAFHFILSYAPTRYAYGVMV